MVQFVCVMCVSDFESSHTESSSRQVGNNRASPDGYEQIVLTHVQIVHTNAMHFFRDNSSPPNQF